MQTPQQMPMASVAQAKQMFGRTLAGWAQNVLSLRRSGLDRPCFRLGSWTDQSGASLQFPDLSGPTRQADAA